MHATKPILQVQSPRFDLIEAADKCRELATGRDHATRNACLRCAARLYRAAGAEGMALLAEELM